MMEETINFKYLLLTESWAGLYMPQRIELESTKILTNYRSYPKPKVQNKIDRISPLNAQKQNRNSWTECRNTEI